MIRKPEAGLPLPVWILCRFTSGFLEHRNENPLYGILFSFGGPERNGRRAAGGIRTCGCDILINSLFGEDPDRNRFKMKCFKSRFITAFRFEAQRHDIIRLLCAFDLNRFPVRKAFGGIVFTLFTGGVVSDQSILFFGISRRCSEYERLMKPFLMALFEFFQIKMIPILFILVHWEMRPGLSYATLKRNKILYFHLVAMLLSYPT